MFENPLLAGGALVAGLALGYFLRRFVAAGRASSLEERLKRELEEAKTEAKAILVEAKEKASGILDEAKREAKKREEQLSKSEERLLRKEEDFERSRRDIEGREAALKDEAGKVNVLRSEVAERERKATNELERIAGFTAEAAKQELLSRVERAHRDEVVRTVQKLERERREEVEKRSLEIITTALGRYARSHVAELTTTLFTLPNEELKGKIIGREGRNIRALERLTGVEVLMDESPDTIIFSSFDPLRREIAKVAMEKLIRDGRIQPAKIEEKVEEAKSELAKRMQSLGEQAALEVGVLDLPKEILQLVGRLHFRTSYGQNVLVH